MKEKKIQPCGSNDNIKFMSIFQTSRYDCEDVWRHFEEAVVSRSPCNVTVEDYHHMFMALAQTPPPPCDRVRGRGGGILSLHR